MIKRFRLWLLRRRLENALKHEESLRRSLKYAQRAVLPALEEEIESLEFELSVDELMKADK